MGIWDFNKNAPAQEQTQEVQEYEQAEPQPTLEDYGLMPQPRQQTSLGTDYYKESQFKAYRDEMLELKALLEGKVLIIDKHGNDTYDYPCEVKRDPKTGQPIKNENGEYEKIIIIDPFCNLQGQKTILAFASMRLRAGTVLSNYSIDTVLDRTYDDANKLALELKLNLRKWGIDATRWEELHFTIMDRIEAARRRAVNNEERKGTGASMTVSTIHQDSPNGQRVGYFSGLMGGNKSRM